MLLLMEGAWWLFVAGVWIFMFAAIGGGPPANPEDLVNAYHAGAFGKE